MKEYKELRQTINIKLTLLVSLLAIFVFCAIGIVSYYKSSIALSKSITQSLLDRAQDDSGLISKNIEQFKKIIEGIAFRTKIESMNWDIQKPTLISEAKRLGINMFSVIDLQGNTKSTSGQTAIVTDREYFKKALQGDTYISDNFRGRISNTIIIVCATPIKDNYGNVIGVLSASVNPQYFFDLIKDRIIGKTGYCFIFNSKGKLIAYPDSSLITSESYIDKEIQEQSHYRKPILNTNDMVSKNMGFGFYIQNGTEKCASFAHIPNTNWSLALTAPRDEIFNEVDNLRYIFTILAIVAILIGVVLSFFIFRYIYANRKMEVLEGRIENGQKLLMESIEIEKIRTNFFANISHEFRTPLNVILGTLQLFDLHPDRELIVDPESMKKRIKIIKQNCFRLLRLVNNLIDTTRIDVGHIETHIQNCNIVSIIEEITLSIADYTDIKDIELLFDTDIEEKIISCDVDKIERIMLNLLSNAIKFTEPGGKITVHIKSNADNIIISVKDTGIGIPKEKQSLIFERFMQVENSLTRSHEGSGIGLSLVKSFTEMHGGKITVVSESGQGSEFIIDLPISITTQVDNNKIVQNDLLKQNRIEKINIEFSDIYQ